MMSMPVTPNKCFMTAVMQVDLQMDSNSISICLWYCHIIATLETLFPCMHGIGLWGSGDGIDKSKGSFKESAASQLKEKLSLLGGTLSLFPS